MSAHLKNRGSFHLAIPPALACLVCLLLMWVSPAASQADEAEWMYNPNAVVEIELGELSAEELQKLEEEPDEYQKGTFELKIGGTPVAPAAEASIRLKGGIGSFRPITEKAAFKVKFPKKTPFFGLRKMTLNNMVQDSSMIDETLAYEMFRAFGVPASRTGYAFVRVDGVKYGVYLNLETLDEISLGHLFASTQHLYEADAPGTDLRPGQASTFEVDEGDETNISDLEALINAANNLSGDWSNNVSSVADLTELVQMWAVERYIGHWDGYAGRAGEEKYRPNNYYLHSDTNGIFTMMPWGTDQTFGTLEPGGTTVLSFGEPAGGRIFNYCYEDASCKEMYDRDLERIYNEVSKLSLDSHAAALAQMLAPYEAMEEDPHREFTASEIAAGVSRTRQFIANRQSELYAYLHPTSPTPPPGTEPRLAKIGKTEFRKGVVITHLTAFEPGVALQKVMTHLGHHRVKVCTGRREVHRARAVTVACRVSKRVRFRIRAGHRVHLNVRAGFTNDAGGYAFKVHHLTVPHHS